MSAIFMRCKNCKGIYLTGMVCPDGSTEHVAEFIDPLEEVARIPQELPGE